MLAMPIYAESRQFQAAIGSRGPDILTIGGITLNTTRYVDRLDPATNGNVEESEMSLLARAQSRELDVLKEELGRSMRAIIGVS